MITREDAEEAEQVVKWCDDLEKSRAFQEIVLKELEAKRDEHDRCGTDVNKKPRVRAEHHMALRLARQFTGYQDELPYVQARKESALRILEEWKKQNGEKLVFLPDARNV